MAYETGDGVYLDVGQVPGYGLLARQSLDSLRTGARVEAVEEKRSPLDFALWKKAKPGEPTWEAPWHAGRPGWHTECVVMSLDLLGDGFDLHGGGQDLAFPHHENERAQAVADGRDFARHWVHNGWVEVEGTKMSKSLGNFTSLTDMLERSDGRAYRLLVFRAHYRSPIEVTTQTVADAEKGLDRLDALARRFGIPDLLAASGRGYVVEASDAGDADPAALASFRTRMDDDLDTPGALAGVFELVTAAHSVADAGDADEGPGWPGPQPSWRRRWVFPSGEGPATWTRPPPDSSPNATRHAGPRTSPGPTRCATSWWRWGGPSRTRRREPPSIADRISGSGATGER